MLKSFRVLLGFLVCTLLLVGVFFRFYNINKKVYWRDEVNVMIRVSGYTDEEIIENYYDGQINSATDLQRYITTDSGRGFSGLIRSMVREDLTNAPLYFVMSWLWMKCFGFSMENLRIMSALLSLLVFPCVWWLSQELFKSKRTALIACLLIAVSPFYLLYSQEARQYSLLTVMILLSSASFLRAVRVNTKAGWILYSLTAIIGTYTQWWFLFIMVGHAIHIMTIKGARARVSLNFYLSFFISCIIVAFSWGLAVVSTLPISTSGYFAWQNAPFSVPEIAKRWGINIRGIFFDTVWEKIATGFDLNKSITGGIDLMMGVIIFTMLGFSFYFLFSKAERKAKIFILAIIAVATVPLLLPDLMFGGVRSAIPRYLIPLYLMVQLTVAYFFAEHITPDFVQLWQRRIWQFVFVIIIFAGLFSCRMISKSVIWWNKYDDIQNLIFANKVNNSRHPLVISDARPDIVLSLAYMLEPKARFQLVAGSVAPEIPKGYSDIFVFRPSRKMILTFKNKPGFVFQDIGWLGSFWELKKK